eukprot:239908-Chlamydomonas_euryale.AAC.1
MQAADAVDLVCGPVQEAPTEADAQAEAGREGAALRQAGTAAFGLAPAPGRDSSWLTPSVQAALDRRRAAYRKWMAARQASWAAEQEALDAAEGRTGGEAGSSGGAGGAGGADGSAAVGAPDRPALRVTALAEHT